MVPLGNVLATLTIASLQVAVLIVAAVAWARHAAHVGGRRRLVRLRDALLAVGCTAIAETMAVRIATQEEYVGAPPGAGNRAVVLRRLAVPDQALPRAPDVGGEVPAWTHALALMRYGLVGGQASGLSAIWGQHSNASMAAASLGVVAAFTVVLLAVATQEASPPSSSAVAYSTADRTRPRAGRSQLVKSASHYPNAGQRRRQAERREQRGAERRDLGDRAVLDAQHVELERPELRVARPAQVARRRRHPVGQRRQQAPVALAVRAERALQQRRDRVEPVVAATGTAAS